jgi:hypothetical protein
MKEKIHDLPQHRKKKLKLDCAREYGTHLQKLWLQVMDTADLNRLKLPQKKERGEIN